MRLNEFNTEPHHIEGFDYILIDCMSWFLVNADKVSSLESLDIPQSREVLLSTVMEISREKVKSGVFEAEIPRVAET